MRSWKYFNDWRDKRLKRQPCAHCGKAFKVSGARDTYCSRECYKKSVKRIGVDSLEKINGFKIE